MCVLALHAFLALPACIFTFFHSILARPRMWFGHWPRDLSPLSSQQLTRCGCRRWCVCVCLLACLCVCVSWLMQPPLFCRFAPRLWTARWCQTCWGMSHTITLGIAHGPKQFKWWSKPAVHNPASEACVTRLREQPRTSKLDRLQTINLKQGITSQFKYMEQSPSNQRWPSWQFNGAIIN